MKFENLDLLKFEKIERQELGLLVGGTIVGWASTGAPELNYPVQWTSDYSRNTGPRQTVNEIHVIVGGDITEAQMLERIK